MAKSTGCALNKAGDNCRQLCDPLFSFVLFRTVVIDLVSFGGRHLFVVPGRFFRSHANKHLVYEAVNLSKNSCVVEMQQKLKNFTLMLPSNKLLLQTIISSSCLVTLSLLAGQFLSYFKGFISKYYLFIM